jgi:hypothetical protein
VGEVVEAPVAVVVVQGVGVVGEVSLEQVEMTVQVVVAHGHAHSGLLDSVITKGHTAKHAFLAEGAVAVVHEQQTGRGIAGHVDIGPTVFVKISGNNGHTVGVRAA